MESVEASPGGGVTGVLANQRIRLGSARFLAESGVSLEASESLVREAEAAGETPVLVAVDNQVVGVMGLLDKPRASAAAAIRDLRSLGIDRFLMLTGDRPEVARRVAEEVGLSADEVRAGLLPAEKAAAVVELEQGAGLAVAMLGDGINDAPALARASAGLAVSHRGMGVDLAAEAGDAVLLGAPLEHLGLLVRLSRKTREVIGQNILWFALGANIVGMAVTAWLWPWIAPASWRNQSPLAAAIYHQLASVLVLVNSMRLLWFERPAPAALTRLGNFSESVGRWGERLAPGELLHHAAHHAGKIATGAAVAGLALWLWTGMHVIPAQEQGKVLRFGRLLEGTLAPGFHWRLPWPAERVARVVPGRSRSVTVGFRPEPKPAGAQATAQTARTWTSAHASEGILRQQEESLVITGDGYLVEMLATIRYRIRNENPFQSLFELGDPDRLVRVAAETVLRELAAEGAFSDLLTSRRGELETRARQVLAARMGPEVGDVPGLEVEGVSLHDLHPPPEVVGSYHEVTRAMESRQQRQNQAQAATLRKRGEQVARDEDLLAKAFVESFTRLENAKATGAAFLTRLAVRGTSPGLVDFRLFWDTVGTALAGREKLLIDSPGVPTRSALWLIPPEVVRPVFQSQRTRGDQTSPREEDSPARQP
jgi:Cu+-exporting ATPase